MQAVVTAETAKPLGSGTACSITSQVVQRRLVSQVIEVVGEAANRVAMKLALLLPGDQKEVGSKCDN
jgi:hypothetical protein